jgi:hypothetical protein
MEPDPPKPRERDKAVRQVYGCKLCQERGKPRKFATMDGARNHLAAYHGLEDK